MAAKRIRSIEIDKNGNEVVVEWGHRTVEFPLIAADGERYNLVQRVTPDSTPDEIVRHNAILALCLRSGGVGGRVRARQDLTSGELAEYRALQNKTPDQWSGVELQAYVRLTEGASYDELSLPAMFNTLSGWREAYCPDGVWESDMVRNSYQEMVRTFRERAKALVPALPSHLFTDEGKGGGLAFLPFGFLQMPLANYERPGERESVQLELKWPGSKAPQHCEAYTMRRGRKLPLTGTQESILHTLFNDEFLNLSDGCIAGTVARLRELIGSRAPRRAQLIEDLNAIGELRVVWPEVRWQRNAKERYRVQGPIFTLTVTPSGDGEFLFAVNRQLVFGILATYFQTIDLRKLWSIDKPRDRHLYAYMCWFASSPHPQSVARVATSNGFPYPDTGKGSRQRRYQSRHALEKSLYAIREATRDFDMLPGATRWWSTQGPRKHLVSWRYTGPDRSKRNRSTGISPNMAAIIEGVLSEHGASPMEIAAAVERLRAADSVGLLPEP